MLIIAHYGISDKCYDNKNSRSCFEIHRFLFQVRYSTDKPDTLWLIITHYGSQWDCVQPSESLKAYGLNECIS